MTPVRRSVFLVDDGPGDLDAERLGHTAGRVFRVAIELTVRRRGGVVFAKAHAGLSPVETEVGYTMASCEDVALG